MKFLKVLGYSLLTIIVLIGGLTCYLYLSSEDVPYNDIPTDTVVHDSLYIDQIQEARHQLKTFMEDRNLPSVSLSIAVDSAILWNEAIGYENLHQRKPATVSSLYNIGSISKSLTTVALGTMLEDSLLKLDDSVYKYVKDFPKKNYDITLEQLASHQAGIRHYQLSFDYLWSELIHSKQYQNVQEGFEKFRDDSLLFEPGTDFNYSTYGYTLLSGAMVGAGDQSFLNLMQNRVLEPLQMNQTTAEFIPGRPSPKDVTNYLELGFFGGALTPVHNPNNSYKWAGGGYLSTPSDLNKLAVGLMNNTILTAETFENLSQARPLRNGSMNPDSYAIGWRTEMRDASFDSNQKLRVVHHGGSTLGSNAFLLMYPKEKVSIALTVNSIPEYTENYREKFYEIAEIFIANNI